MKRACGPASTCMNSSTGRQISGLPKGLMYGLQCLDSWLYGGDPMMHLEYDETFKA